jgi:sulfite reductase (NADPH) flavoprotein alpha-component
MIPETAPFAPDQRAWLNGFFAGLLGDAAPSAAPAAPVEDDGDLPWHDPALELDARLALAEGKPVRLKLMAAMGQLDCGQCGYLCKTYAEAIASGIESDLRKCVPGGKATAKVVKMLVVELGPRLHGDDKSAGVTQVAVTPAQAGAQSEAVTPAQAGAQSLGPRLHGNDKSAAITRDRPAKVKLLHCIPLNGPESDKDTRAVALALGETGLTYEPGDSLGVWPTNNPDLVELVLSILGAKGTKPVVLDGDAISARDALTNKVSLREPTAELFALLAEHAKLDFEAQRLAFLAEDDERAVAYGVHDVFDALVKFRSARPPVGAFLRALSRLQPRLYSIASSLRRHPGEVHLTVGVVRYDLGGRGYQGLGSGYFAEHLRAGRPVPVFVQKAHGFALPENPATPVIMVGPGTGIAPFRAFLEERAATGAKGKNWLFFGDQHAAEDFLYRDELESHAGTGLLTTLSTAFSRDQAAKVYVQHRMLEAGAALWSWLEEGAHVYVCGDAKRMASDVEHALAEVVATHGGKSKAEAAGFLKDLARQGRYQRDVY